MNWFWLDKYWSMCAETGSSLRIMHQEKDLYRIEHTLAFPTGATKINYGRVFKTHKEAFEELNKLAKQFERV